MYIYPSMETELKVQVNICLMLGCWGGFFFFPGIKAAVGIMKKDPYSSFCFLKIIYFGCTESSCCSWAFSSCGDRGYYLAVVLGLLIVVASLVAEH